MIWASVFSFLAFWQQFFECTLPEHAEPCLAMFFVFMGLPLDVFSFFAVLTCDYEPTAIEYASVLSLRIINSFLVGHTLAYFINRLAFNRRKQKIKGEQGNASH